MSILTVDGKLASQFGKSITSQMIDYSEENDILLVLWVSLSVLRMLSRRPQTTSRAVYHLNFFDTDTNTDTDTLIMIQILNDTDTDTFTTKCQHIL